MSKELNNNTGADFRNSIDDHSGFLSIDPRDLGKWNATSHRKEVKPDSQPRKLTNGRMAVHYKDDLKEKKQIFP